MRNHTVGKPARAWMIIGMANSLQAFRSQSRPQADDARNDEEHNSRCYWSIFILEKAFSHHSGTFGQNENAPDYPPSAPWPPPLCADDTNGTVVDPSDEAEGLKDIGILPHYIELISIWGDVCSYLQEPRPSKAESPWLPDSTGTKLSRQMYECEARLPPRHLLRNVAFPGRSVSELLEHQEYWALWGPMQIAFHAVPSILNHPFLHLVTTHEGNRAPKSRVFLQQTVDTALYNSGWVARLLRIFDNLPFEFTNPLVGHMVAGTATVLWFFQFARDSKVSRQANEDLDQCERFLERMSTKWPHIAQKVCCSSLTRS
jgi:hypothetical protein